MQLTVWERAINHAIYLGIADIKERIFSQLWSESKRPEANYRNLITGKTKAKKITIDVFSKECKLPFNFFEDEK